MRCPNGDGEARQRRADRERSRPSARRARRAIRRKEKKMSVQKRRLTELSGAELEELLGLIKGSDSVELKLTVPETGHRSAINALRLDPLDAQIRQIFFFDTPD